MAHASRSNAAALGAHQHAEYPASHLDGVKLPSHLVAFQASATTTTTAPPTTTTTAPAATTTTAAPTTTTTAPPPPPPTTTTTTTTVPPPSHHQAGQATWYAQAPTGMCASPTLPFGTVITVGNNATGASTVCRVDDREDSDYPRVVDLSPEGFSQIADLNQGVVDVTISW